MYKISFVALLIIFSQISLAARPPEVQDSMDRDIMNEYLEAHPDISSIVKEIDYWDYKIHLNNNCTIIFNREFQLRLPGFVGGAPALQYSKKICDDDHHDPVYSD